MIAWVLGVVAVVLLVLLVLVPLRRFLLRDFDTASREGTSL